MVVDFNSAQFHWLQCSYTILHKQKTYPRMVKKERIRTGLLLFCVHTLIFFQKKSLKKPHLNKIKLNNNNQQNKHNKTKQNN